MTKKALDELREMARKKELSDREEDLLEHISQLEDKLSEANDTCERLRRSRPIWNDPL